MENKQQNSGLFREKSLQRAQSPESLNGYLKVTSPGVWLVLSAVIVLLIGTVIWGIFGRIQSTEKVAVIAEGDECVCLVPYDDLESISELNSITIEGNTYTLRPDMSADPIIVSESMNSYALTVGGLEIGDVVLEVPVEAELSDNIYTGTIVTESIQPISLLLQ